MASQQPRRDIADLPDVISACLTPFDDSFLGPTNSKSSLDAEEKRRQLGREMLQRHNDNNDNLIHQAVTDLKSRMKPYTPAQVRERPQQSDPKVSAAIELDIDEAELSWTERVQRASRLKMSRTPAEETIIASLKQPAPEAPEEPLTYEVNPADEVVAAFTRYVDALQENDNAHFEELKKYQHVDTTTGQLKKYLYSVLTRRTTGIERERFHSQGKTGGRAAGKEGRKKSHHRSENTKMQTSVRASPSDEDVSMSITSADEPPSRRDSFAKPSAPGTPRIGTVTEYNEQRVGGTQGPLQGNQQSQKKGNLSLQNTGVHLQSIFAQHERPYRGRDRSRERARGKR